MPMRAKFHQERCVHSDEVLLGLTVRLTQRDLELIPPFLRGDIIERLEHASTSVVGRLHLLADFLRAIEDQALDSPGLRPSGRALDLGQ